VRRLDDQQEGSMAVATIPEPTTMREPFGLVVRDVDEEHRHPRISLYFWAREEETDEEERH
jgi:hypothetical protein